MPLRRRKEDAAAAAAAAATATAKKTSPSSPTKKRNGGGASSSPPPPSPKRTTTNKITDSDAAHADVADLLRHHRKSHRRALTACACAVALAATTYALWQQNKALRAALSPLAQLARETELFGGGISALESLRDVAADVLRSGGGGASSSRAALLASSPGAAAAAAGHGPHHPVVIIPGFVTSSLELWSGPRCASRYFRSRFWGGLSMTTRLLGDKRCWLETMALDPRTGLDPETAREEEEEDDEEEAGEEEDRTQNKSNNIKNRRRRTTRLRAVEGLAGVDYFMPGYGVWARVIEELARLGYDATNAAAETYDWRLRVLDLERRDGFFTRLKARCETMVATNSEKQKLRGGGKDGREKVKVAILAHSWGDSVARAFFLWADRRDPGWTERHVAAYLNIAGPTLGAAKSLPALLSGETRDTAELGAVAAFLGENYVPRRLRAELFRTWPGAFGMLPLGGTRVWGSVVGGGAAGGGGGGGGGGGSAPDDTPAMRKRGISHGALLTVVEDDDDDDVEGEGEIDERAKAKAKARAKGRRTPSGRKRRREGRLDVDRALDLLSDALPSHAAAHVADAVSGAAGGRKSRNSGGSTGGESTGDGNDNDDGSSPETPCHEGAVDPLRCPLPSAPSMRLYCIYGVGKPTERSYVYVKSRSSSSSNSSPSSSPSGSSSSASSPESVAASEDREAARGEATPGKAASAAAEAAREAEELRIDTEANEEDGLWSEEEGEREREGGAAATAAAKAAAKAAAVADTDAPATSSPSSSPPPPQPPPAPSRPFGSLENGVRVSDGDGTVPLISLGTLCARHWRASSSTAGDGRPSRLNPANLTIVTREAAHAPREFLIGGTLDPRGGAGSADHVDILMNEYALRDIVDIVSGRGEGLEDRIFSDIREIASRVEI